MVVVMVERVVLERMVWVWVRVWMWMLVLVVEQDGVVRKVCWQGRRHRSSHGACLTLGSAGAGRADSWVVFKCSLW